MLNNVFIKTLYEKRWMILGWTLGVAAMSMLTFAFYPSFKQGGFDEVLKNIPKSFQSLIGDPSNYKTVQGFIGQEIYALRVPMVTLVMAIVLFTGLLAGDEDKGTLQTLLAQPISRTSLYIQKYLAGAVISFVVCAGAVLGIMLVVPFIHEHADLLRLFQATVGVWLLTMVFSTIGFAAGAITGKRGLAGGLAGLFTFGAYLLTSLVPSVDKIKPLEKISPFHYYNNPLIARFGLVGHDVLILMLPAVALFLIALYIFNRRDIYQK